MLAWISALIKGFVALLSFRQGESAGAANERSADIAKANTADQEIVHAEDSAPSSRADLIARLRDPDAKI